MSHKKELAECVGLWLAEGDNKTKAEITFTNNSYELIELFYRNLRKIFNNDNYRIYIYSPSKKIKPSIKLNVTIKNYIDKRANKPYFIVRLADVVAVRKWHNLVESYLKNEDLYPSILRGFFAGEGNLKEIKKSGVRVIRISQKKPKVYVDKILNNLEIEFSFSSRERAYIIYGRNNWKKFYEMKIYELHPEKRKRFLEIYDNYKEWHYKKHHIRNEILAGLDRPYTSRELSIKFGRTQSRLQDILIELKKIGKIKNFRVGSYDYWIGTSDDAILISEKKKRILDFLTKPRKTTEISKRFGNCWKNSHERVKEMEKLGLVENKLGVWHRKNIDKRVMTI